MLDTLEFLVRVWGAQADYLEETHIGASPPFAFLSIRTGPGAWQDLAFKYPHDTIELPDSGLGDIYFCPNLFSRPRRRKELVLPSCWLYADLDTVKPPQTKYRDARDLAMEPSIAWESSPGRYQALWHLDRHLHRVSHQQLNRKLTYALGADKGGWDLTQVLRVPGTINHKYDEKPEVKLLWA